MENQDSQLDTLRRIEGLAASFPVLAGVPGVSEWDPMELEDWVVSGLATDSHGRGSVLSSYSMLRTTVNIRLAE